MNMTNFIKESVNKAGTGATSINNKNLSKNSTNMFNGTASSNSSSCSSNMSTINTNSTASSNTNNPNNSINTQGSLGRNAQSNHSSFDITNGINLTLTFNILNKFFFCQSTYQQKHYILM